MQVSMNLPNEHIKVRNMWSNGKRDDLSDGYMGLNLCLICGTINDHNEIISFVNSL